ncbi:hypothetical protein BJ741DRAFT_651491 [Chytriomyces cf. hyalinus JEL632]|nr:hypothetical protein BJ741DRAFT_651491 [Chytriomyces cf. hyalinus JEL632]
MHPIALVLFLVSGALAYECRCMCSGIIYANSNAYDCGNYCAATLSARGGKSKVCPNGSLAWQLVDGSSLRWSAGGYAGLVLGTMALVVGVLVAVWFCRRRKTADLNTAPQPVYLNPVYNSSPVYTSPSYGTANQNAPSSYANQASNAPVAYPTAPTSYAEPAQAPPGFYAPPSQPPPNQQSLGTYRM